MSDGIDGLLTRLAKLNEVGVTLSEERDIRRLLEDILHAAKDLKMRMAARSI